MINNNSPIGIFDSGLGGLTVVKAILDEMPGESVIFFGDTARVPYGNRSQEQIKEYVKEDVRFLRSFDIKALVIACNTADSVTGEYLENTLPLPVFGVISPASQKAVKTTRNKKIAVIATKATVNSGKYEKTVKAFSPDCGVISVPCPLLVPLVEDGRFDRGNEITRKVLEEYLEPVKAYGADTLILGCTHYPLLEDMIRDLCPELNIISSSKECALKVKTAFEKNSMLSDDNVRSSRYFVSDRAKDFEVTAGMFMGRELDGAIKEVTL